MSALLRAVLLLATASGGAVVHAAGTADAEARAIVARHCVACHARTPTHPSFDKPPKGVALESIDDLEAWAAKIQQQVVEDRNMPIGNDTGMTEEERTTLARWIESLR
jgi:uncharacterized membrane protein